MRNDMNFEESIKRLNEIVSILDSGNAELDRSLTLFEEGAELIKNCNKMLDEAEQKVRILKDGEEVPFDV